MQSAPGWGGGIARSVAQTQFGPLLNSPGSFIWVERSKGQKLTLSTMEGESLRQK